MKTEDAVRMSDNLVGIEVHTIQDVVKAQADRSNRGRRGAMSEINFKAKRIRTDEWIDCNPIKPNEIFHNSNIGVINKCSIDLNTICKSTGAQDCDGIPIYEHDLLRCKKTDSIFEVVWNQGNTSFSLVNTEYPVLYPTDTLGRMLHNRHLKVVGNKFDKKGGKK